MKIPIPKLSDIVNPKDLKDLYERVKELNGGLKGEEINLAGAWKYNFPVYSQTTWAITYKKMLILIQEGPEQVINQEGKRVIHWVLCIPPKSLKDIVNHIEKCLVYRRESRGTPWDIVIRNDNETISLTRTSGIGTSVLRGQFGYIIENKSRGQGTSISDHIMIKKGFLDYLKEIERGIAEADPITSNKDD